MTLYVGGLFDGCGLLAYGLHLAGLEHRWLCELVPFRRELLERRFGVPVYPDVRSVGPDAPRVDVIAGGFPCKGVSSVGPRNGFRHPETALWREMLRVVRELRPRYVLVENVADLLTLHRGELFGEVLGGLAESGYDAEWDCFPAAAFGAPHTRDRVFVTAFAHADRRRCESAQPSLRAGQPDTSGSSGGAPDTDRIGRHQADATGVTPINANEHGRRPCNGARPASAIVADADADGRPRFARPKTGRDAVHGEERRDVDGCGIRTCWGAYEPAVRRWEAIVGRPSPEPLVRRVDDGRTASVERSRLFALGDGVLVQAGWLCGRRILEHAEQFVTEFVA